MATEEQIQEALHLLQPQEVHIAALEIQLQVEQTRTQTAELERSTLIQTLGAMRQDRGGADSKGICQNFILKGVGEQDFGEWTHKVRTFMLARFGDQILVAPTWAARQRKIVVKACGSSQRDRFAPWIDVFGTGADEEDQIDGIDDFVRRSSHTLSPLQPTHPTSSSGTQAKAMAWKPGDDCTASTTPRRPCDEWRSFSRFRTHRVVSELRIQDLRWETGSRRNVKTRCSLTVTDGPARHQMTALWRRYSD